MKEIDLVFRTMFAELCQRSSDASFQSDFPVEGRFVSVPVKGKSYWYFDRPADGKTVRTYVGPKSDPDITKRVTDFQEIKTDLKSRRKLVSTLTREAGLPAPERFTGDIVAALSSAGLFRVRGVLVGTVAFPCYAGILGVRLPSTAMQTGDADFAQFHSISAAVGIRSRPFSSSSDTSIRASEKCQIKAMGEWRRRSRTVRASESNF